MICVILDKLWYSTVERRIGDSVSNPAINKSAWEIKYTLLYFSKITYSSMEPCGGVWYWQPFRRGIINWKPFFCKLINYLILFRCMLCCHRINIFLYYPHSSILHKNKWPFIWGKSLQYLEILSICPVSPGKWFHYTKQRQLPGKGITDYQHIKEW